MGHLPFPNGLLEQALVVGHVTDATARVWFRSTRSSPHTIVARALSGEHPAVTAHAEPDRSRDHTASVDLAGLAPDAVYALSVTDANGRSALRDGIVPRVRTLPRAGRWDRLAFGVASCHLPYRVGAHDGDVTLAPELGILERFESALEAHDARFVLHIGDQVYADGAPSLDAAHAARQAGTTAERALELYREVYRGYWNFDGLARIHARFANYMVWDDHEVCDDWGSHPAHDPREAARDAQVFEAARRAYDEYQHAHNPGTNAHGYHYAFGAGSLAAFFVMDLRGQRDVARGVLLGEAQWRDFHAWLAATRSVPLRFVVCSVPPHHVPDVLVERMTGLPHAEGHLPDALFDRWSAAAFAHEQRRLMEALASDAGAGVIVLSGDIHLGAAAEFTPGGETAPRIQQWITSALTNNRSWKARVKAQLLARATNLATRWPTRQFFHEPRPNFAIVTATREPAGYALAFHLYAWDGHDARLAFTVERPAGGGPATLREHR